MHLVLILFFSNLDRREIFVESDDDDDDILNFMMFENRRNVRPRIEPRVGQAPRPRAEAPRPRDEAPRVVQAPRAEAPPADAPPAEVNPQQPAARGSRSRSPRNRSSIRGTFGGFLNSEGTAIRSPVH